MKRNRLLLVALLSAIAGLAHADTQTLTLTFNESDFTFTEKDGLTYINTTLKGAQLDEDETAPALPIFYQQVPIFNNDKFCGFSYTLHKHLIASNVTIAKNPIITCSDVEILPESSIKQDENFSYSIYPEENFGVTTLGVWDDASLLQVTYTPFIYEAQTKNLYLVDRIDANLTFKKATVRKSKSLGTSLNRAPEYISTIVRPPLWRDSTKLERDTIPNVNNGPVESFLLKTDYLLITNKALMPAFQTLLDWKKTKGLDVESISVEEIDATVSGNDLPHKIKKYIHKRYKEDYLKYVLLGGDDAIVPSRKCYGLVHQKDSTIPADLYYACFGNQFDWDYNKNGVFGEGADSLSLIPSVYVTRLPIRSADDVAAYTKKLLRYEKMGVMNNTLLQAGSSIGDSINVDMDSIYNRHVLPYWSGQRTRFFDRITDMPGGANYDFIKTNIAEQLSKGYGFVDILTHGYVTQWCGEDDNSTNNYTIHDAEIQENSGSTIIMTTSCYPNAFDSPGSTYFIPNDPCLGEAFIRNESNGVIAMYGCSRTSRHTAMRGKHPLMTYWFTDSKKYTDALYEYIFSKDCPKNWGYLTSVSKAAHAQIKHNTTGRQPRTYFSVDQLVFVPFGDPETPLFTETPKRFSNVDISFVNDSLLINCNEDDCRICVFGKRIDGSSFRRVKERTSSYTLSFVPLEFTLCITKQNFIPQLYNVSIPKNSKKLNIKSLEEDVNLEKDFAINNSRIVSCNTNDTNIAITTETPVGSNNASIIVTNLMGNTEKNITLAVDDITQTTEITGLSSGIHVVSLVVDGQVVDSKRLIKK